MKDVCLSASGMFMQLSHLSVVQPALRQSTRTPKLLAHMPSSPSTGMSTIVYTLTSSRPVVSDMECGTLLSPYTSFFTALMAKGAKKNIVSLA